MSRNFAVIGHPIGHTMSPFLNARLFEAAGKPASYTAKDISPDILSRSIEELRQLDGFNITIPHKQAIIPLLDGLDEKARLFGSVNTVKNGGGRLTGYTTDGAGFRFALKSAGIPLSGNLLVLGAGGVSRVMALEGLMEGCRVYIAARRMEQAQALAADLLKACGKKAEAFPLNETERFAESQGLTFDLAVNGTPLGMYPKEGESPLGPGGFRRCKAVFDAVYNPRETRFLQLAEETGIQTAGGMAMLVGQAAEAHRIWDGSHYETGDLLTLCREAENEMKRLFGGN
jgi:shikimate dehydrogenase